jgi:hypothetical protein
VEIEDRPPKMEVVSSELGIHVLSKQCPNAPLHVTQGRICLKETSGE